MPSAIARLKEIVDRESDPSSPFHTSKVDEDAFSRPKLYAWDDPRVKELDITDFRVPDLLESIGHGAGGAEDGQAADGGDGSSDEEGDEEEAGDEAGNEKKSDVNGDVAAGLEKRMPKTRKGGVKWFEVMPQNETIKAMTDVTTR